MDFFSSLEFVISLIIGLGVVTVLAVVALAGGKSAPPIEQAPADAEPLEGGVDVLEKDPGGPGTVEAPVMEPSGDEPAVVDVEADEPEVQEPAAPALDVPIPAQGRLARLRARLSRSNSMLGKGLLALLSRETISEDDWEEMEDLLISADLGVEASTELIDTLREKVKILGTSDTAQVKEMLADELLAMVGPDLDRSLADQRVGDRPSVVLVVGVNGVGKTTSVGKIARVMVADDKDVLLGAADTFRAAAADQLQTWGQRVGVPTVRSEKDGGDAAAVAFEAVKEGMEAEADVVLIDTAGRLQNKKGLMDELGKVKRVAEKAMGEGETIDEVLLVLDATTGQNGLRQAEVFAEVVGLTGVVLAKLDGTAKGGIVVAIQRKLGVPVKLVGLGEGPDDLAPFEPRDFVDAILAD